MNRTRRLIFSLALNSVLVIALAVAGAVAHSTGLQADAGHNLTDAGALVLSLVAVRLTLRPANASRSFGNHRATILAALANSSLITVVTAIIVIESIHRFGHPQPVRAGIVIGASMLGFFVNGVAALVLHDRSGDLNIRAAALHMVGDAFASCAVIVAGVVLLVIPQATWVDPVSALAVASIIVFQAVRLLRESVAILLESTPPGLDLHQLTATMEGVPGVTEVHDLHVWSLSTELRVLSAHVIVAGDPTLLESQAIGALIKRTVAQPFAISHSTLELESDRCNNENEDPCRMEAFPAVRTIHRHG